MLLKLKELLLAFGEFIDAKLQTQSGRMTLLIIGGIILGASSIHAFNITSKYNELKITYDIEKKSSDSLQLKVNNLITNADNQCNEKIKQGILLHQQLQQMYNNKIEQNEEIVNQQKQIIEEKKKVLSVQEDNINELKNLTE